MLYRGRKRGRQDKPIVNELKINLVSNTVTESGLNDISLEEEEVKNRLKTPGNFKAKTEGSVYLKLQVGVGEAYHINENRDETIDVVKQLADKSSDVNITVSSPVQGAIERFVTLDGELDAVVKAGLYLAFLRNKWNKNSKADLTICIMLQDHLSNERTRQIEQRAKFTGIQYYDLQRLNYQSSGTILKLSVVGNIKKLYEFLMYIVETSPHKHQYLEDSRIFQFPVIKIGDSNLYQTQDVNEGKLEKSMQEALKFIYGDEYIEKSTST